MMLWLLLLTPFVSSFYLQGGMNRQSTPFQRFSPVKRAKLGEIVRCNMWLTPTGEDAPDRMLPLRPGAVVEYVKNNRLCFGTYVSPKNLSNSKSDLSPSCVPLLHRGETLDKVSVEQLVGTWRAVPVSSIPRGLEEWDACEAAAMGILGSMSSRSLDLLEFWEAMRKRGIRVVGSMELATFLFKEKGKMVGSMKQATRIPRSSISSHKSEDQEHVSPEHMYAAAVLLSANKIRFRRNPDTALVTSASRSSAVFRPMVIRGAGRDQTPAPKLLSRKTAAPINAQDAKEAKAFNGVGIIGGGYKCLDPANVMFRQASVFIDRVGLAANLDEKQSGVNHSAVVNSADNVTMTSHSRLNEISERINDQNFVYLCQYLETYANMPLNYTRGSPVGIAHLLKRMNYSASVDSARSLLLDVRFRSSSLDRALATSLRSQQQGLSVDSAAASMPWSEQVLNASRSLAAEIKSYIAEFEESEPGADVIGLFSKAKANDLLDSTKEIEYFGRNVVDLRYMTTLHPAICIDDSKTKFSDDAISFSPRTGEMFVHISNVFSHIASDKYFPLNDALRTRMRSRFYDIGAVHMFPLKALNELKLSSKRTNEVLTMAFKVREADGSIRLDLDSTPRLFLSIISPVHRVSFETADEAISSILEASETAPGSAGFRLEEETVYDAAERLSCAPNVVRDLALIYHLCSPHFEKFSSFDPTFDESYVKTKMQLNQTTQSYGINRVKQTRAFRMLNALLLMYSNASHAFCERNNVPSPVVATNRCKNTPEVVKRFATTPLRSWIALQQQRQLLFAMGGLANFTSLRMDGEQCKEAVKAHEDFTQRVSVLTREDQVFKAFQSIEEKFKQSSISGGNDKKASSDVLLEAVALGDGGRVMLKGYNIISIAKGGRNRPWKAGELVSVRVVDVDASVRRLVLEIVPLDS